MPTAGETREPPARADIGFSTHGGMPDRGPRYTETPPDPFAPDSPFPAEPWNAVTAALFIVLVAVWVVRLRGRFRDFPFLSCCLPILLAGGIGGTLYHSTRTSVAFFLLDVVPISVLGLAGAVFMAVRCWGRRRGLWFLPFLVAFYIGVNEMLFAAVGPSNVEITVNLSYAALAAVVLTPISLVLVRTRGRHGGWVAAGVIAFTIAWFFRLVDHRIGIYLPMGSHWLWHSFGAAATALLMEFFYRVEGDSPICREPSPPERVA